MHLRDGIKSTVLDRRELGREASWAGAGLIAPLSENRAGTLHPTVALRSWSAELFPQWSAELREQTGIDNGYLRSGGVDVAWTAAEEHELQTTAGRWKVEGIAHERLDASDRPLVEPALNPDLPLVYFLPDRAQVRNPWHLRRLGAAAARHGVQLRPWTAVDRLETRGDKVTAVRTSAGVLACDWVIMAAGPWSGGLLGAIGVHAPTPPLKGQIVLLRQDRPLLSRIVEHGKNYLVPRGDGHILIGATEEDAGFDTRLHLGGRAGLVDRGDPIFARYLARPRSRRRGRACVPAASTPSRTSAWRRGFATWSWQPGTSGGLAALAGNRRAGGRTRSGPPARPGSGQFPGRS